MQFAQLKLYCCIGNREVLNLVVKCEGAKNGCEWEREIRSLDQHKSTCLHVPVPCPRECDVGSVLRGDLQSHLQDYCSQRDYECPHCLQMGRYSELVTSHLEKCPMVLTKCPNEGCTKMMFSPKIPAHVANDCPFTVLPCRYSEAGCKVQLPRKDLEEHEKDLKLHLQVATTKIAALQKDVDKLTTALQNTLKDNLITFKITEYRKKRHENTVFCSPSFYTSSEGYKMEIVVVTNGNEDGKGTHISVLANLIRGDHDDRLNWPFVGKVTITLLNQLEDDGHLEKTLDITPENNVCVGNSRGYPKFIRQSRLRLNTENNTQYLMNDTLYFRASVASTSCDKPWLHCTV